MKKIFGILAIALAAAVFVACEKDDDKGGVDYEIVGSWSGDPQEYHYPMATFKKDGSYVWEWGGIHKLKDTGTYTYEDKVIVMKASAYYEEEDGEYKKMNVSEEYASDRKCVVNEINDGLMDVVVKDDFFMGGGDEGFPYVLFRDGLDQKISASDLKGTWDAFYEDGKVMARLIFDGSNYTEYDVWGWSSTNLQASKEVGSWAYKKGTLTLTPTDKWYSSEKEGGAADYTYYTVNQETFEATKWAKTQYDPDPFSTKAYLVDGKLYHGNVVYVKKK